MTLEKEFILSKLNELSEYISEIGDVLTFDDNSILKDGYKMHTAERVFQLAVDTMIDINQHFIRELKLPISDDFQSTFYVLGENSILPKDFANKIAPIVGLRNIIVHRYETINKKRFIEELRKNFADFGLYSKLILEFTEKK